MLFRSISRKSVIQIAEDLGYKVVERDIARSELYVAEEAFLVGTAAELVPVREIDDHDLGGPGEITRELQAKYEDALQGRAQECFVNGWWFSGARRITCTYQGRQRQRAECDPEFPSHGNLRW